MPPGTVHLRSPESVRFHPEPQVRGAVRCTPTDDLYALGVSLYRVVTGHYPFPPHLPRDLLFSDIETEVPPEAMEVNRRLPRPVSDVMHRMLAKDPAERFPNGWELHMHWVAALAYAGSAVDVELFSWEPVPEARRSNPRGLSAASVGPSGPLSARRLQRPGLWALLCSWKRLSGRHLRVRAGPRSPRVLRWPRERSRDGAVGVGACCMSDWWA